MTFESDGSRSLRGVPWLAGGLAAALGLVGVAVSCLDGGGGRPAGQRCSAEEDCAPNLVCRYGRCRPPCAVDRDCGDGGLCIRDGAGGRVCVLPEDLECEGDDCAPVQIDDGGRLVETCSDTRPCEGVGQTCHGGVCVDGEADSDADVDADVDVDADADADGDADAVVDAEVDGDGGPACPTLLPGTDTTPLGGGMQIDGPVVVWAAARGGTTEDYVVAWSEAVPDSAGSILYGRPVATDGRVAGEADVLHSALSQTAGLAAAWSVEARTLALAWRASDEADQHWAYVMTASSVLEPSILPVPHPTSASPDATPALAAVGRDLLLAFVSSAGSLSLHRRSVDDAYGWNDAPETLSEPLTTPRAPALAAADGSSCAAWEEGPTAATGYQMRCVSTAWGGPLRVFGHSPARAPAVAWSEGTAAVAYLDTDEAPASLTLMLSDDITSSQTVVPGVSDAEAPRIAPVSGGFVLAWVSGTSIEAGHLNLDGSCWSRAPAAIGTVGTTVPGEGPRLSLACDGESHCLVAWVMRDVTGPRDVLVRPVEVVR